MAGQSRFARPSEAMKCPNCNSSSVDGALCSVCVQRKACRRCRRRLPDHSFTAADSVVCLACEKKLTCVRHALNFTFEEVRFNTSDDDVVFETYIDLHEDEIREKLEEYRRRMR